MTSDLERLPNFDFGGPPEDDSTVQTFQGEKQSPDPGSFTATADILNEPRFSFEEVDQTSSGGPAPFTTLVTPAAYRGMLEGLSFLVDMPIHALNAVLREGIKGLSAPVEFTDPETGETTTLRPGLPGLSAWAEENLNRPFTFSDISTEIFEAPGAWETLWTGEDPTILDFSASPRPPIGPTERAMADAAYLAGTVATFPIGLAGAGGKLGRGIENFAVERLLSDAAGRTSTSSAARAELTKAFGSNNPAEAMVEVANQYASRYVLGLGRTPVRTLGGEALLGGAASVGYASPEFLDQHEGQIPIDIPGLEQPLDVKPTLKLLASIGFPVLVAHTPSGISLAGGKPAANFIERITRKARRMSMDLLGGVTPEGRYNLAARVVDATFSDPQFMAEVFLPAVRSGTFNSPLSSSPIRILEDGTIVPRFGGINPDTMQALRQLGLEDTRLASLERSLEGVGANLQARRGETLRRSQLLEDTFDLLRTKLQVGDEAITYDVVKRVQDNLATLSDDELATALERARLAYTELEPTVGAEEASNMAVSFLEAARARSRVIKDELWAEDKIGTATVDATALGDWAAEQIAQAGRNRFDPGMGHLYPLAGAKRLAQLNNGKSGEPLTSEDLGGVRLGDELLTPAEIGTDGLYDVFGPPGTVTAAPVTISEVQKLRSQLGYRERAASKLGNRDNEARLLQNIIRQIDDNILIEENLIGELTGENIRNLKIARAYVADQKARWGPDTEIGRILRSNQFVTEEFLNKLIRQGPGSGARVDLFRTALDEPQQTITGDTVTWERNPDAALMPGDNPNVIEAELLRLFTTRVPDGRVTEAAINRFLSDSQYGPAVDRIPGLRERMKNLIGMQEAVDAMSTKITQPTREQLQEAMATGSSIHDVTRAAETAINHNYANLARRRQSNIAAEYLDADPTAAAESFIDRALSDPKYAQSRSDELSRILDTDPTGEAAAGFRAALWKKLRQESRFEVPSDLAGGPPPIGVDGKKLAALRDQLAPFLGKFFGNVGMAYLDEIIKGSSLQIPGIDIPLANIPPSVLVGERGWGTGQAVALGGRTIGQWVGAKLGISGLVATGQGRTAAVYIFKTVGEKEIMQYVEDAFRDPTKMADLIERAQRLPTFKPSPAVVDVGEQVLTEPTDVAKGAFKKATGLSYQAFLKIKNLLQNYSSESIRESVRLGLLPATAESKRIDAETDYRLGPPFIYEENKTRFDLENRPQAVELPPAPVQNEAGEWVVPAQRTRLPPVDMEDIIGLPPPPPQKERTTAPLTEAPPVSESSLAQVLPVGALGGRASPDPERTRRTLTGLQEVGLPLFGEPFQAKKGGLASLRKKSRQLVH